MKLISFGLGIVLLLSGCYKGKKVDLIIHNANILTMSDEETPAQAIAISGGKIIEVGPERQILNKYSAEEEIDAQGRDVTPGFTDAHAHILSYAKQLLCADLVGSKSYDEVLVRLEKYQQRKQRKIIVGRGWDQSLWGEKQLPDNHKLNVLFPEIPVCLIRIDGHAMLVNNAMLKLVNYSTETKVDGGMIETINGKCTGILLDNAMNAVYAKLPSFSEKEIIEAICDIQDELLQYGITGVHEAGISYPDIALFKKLIDRYNFKINLYAMLMPEKKNLDFIKKNGHYTYKNMRIRSIKVIGDGALGSRGALLKHPYEDAHNHHGLLTTPIDKMKEIAAFCLAHNYQMNTHAIGDSTVRILLDVYAKAYQKNRDHRWRIEHAQVVDPRDINLFGKYAIFPSVQPTHAVSDQRWAEQRLGKSRMKGAYAYQSLLQQYGMLALGTDFPIELTDPFLTIHAAVKRKNAGNQPASGFYSNEALTLTECLRGMTIWPAFAAFQENQLGSLEKGKDATLVIWDKPIRSDEQYSANFAHATFIKGEKVFGLD